MASAKTGAGQTVLVTGGSGGIGLALAECFAQDGYDLILTARGADALKTAADRLATQYAVIATPIAADLGAVGGGARLAEQIKQRAITVHLPVNNAGDG